jgi:hypothetical protein
MACCELMGCCGSACACCCVAVAMLLNELSLLPYGSTCRMMAADKAVAQ